MEMEKIRTIGHSIRTIEEFIKATRFEQIGLIADVRLLATRKQRPECNRSKLHVSYGPVAKWFTGNSMPRIASCTGLSRPVRASEVIKSAKFEMFSAGAWVGRDSNPQPTPKVFGTA
jgi:hypothetical protein